MILTLSGSPGDSDGKESACNARDLGSISVLGRSPGEGKATHEFSLYSPWGLKESDTTEQLSLSLSMESVTESFRQDE